MGRLLRIRPFGPQTAVGPLGDFALSEAVSLAGRSQVRREWRGVEERVVGRGGEY